MIIARDLVRAIQLSPTRVARGAAPWARSKRFLPLPVVKKQRGITLEFRWPRAQPSSLVRSLMIERHATAAHLQRVVMRRSNRKENATAPPSRITIQARDHLIELRRHAVTFGSRRQDDAIVPQPHHSRLFRARSDTTCHQTSVAVATGTLSRKVR